MTFLYTFAANIEHTLENQARVRCGARWACNIASTARLLPKEAEPATIQQLCGLQTALSSLPPEPITQNKPRPVSHWREVPLHAVHPDSEGIR